MGGGPERCQPTVLSTTLGYATPPIPSHYMQLKYLSSDVRTCSVVFWGQCMHGRMHGPTEGAMWPRRDEPCLRSPGCT